MKLIAILFCLALLPGCTSPAPGNDKLRKTIETRVRLPQGARPLEAYSRNYAAMPDGKIKGVYVLPDKPLAGSAADDAGCEVLGPIDADGNIESRPCTDTDIAKLAAQDRQHAALFGNADESRWFDNYQELPVIDDGGCDIITIIFDPQTETFERTECNGNA